MSAIDSRVCSVHLSAGRGIPSQQIRNTWKARARGSDTWYHRLLLDLLQDRSVVCARQRRQHNAMVAKGVCTRQRPGWGLTHSTTAFGESN